MESLEKMKSEAESLDSTAQESIIEVHEQQQVHNTSNGNNKDEKEVEGVEEEKGLTEAEEEKEGNVFDDIIKSSMQVREENDIRIAVIGNVDSGKSTLVGVLTKGEMDDGRGSARLKVFNFNHEAQNGRTSSIGQEIMGFDEDDKQIELEKAKQTKN